MVGSFQESGPACPLRALHVAKLGDFFQDFNDQNSFIPEMMAFKSSIPQCLAIGWRRKTWQKNH